MDKKAMYQLMDQTAADFEAMSDAIWEFAEPAFQEVRSSKLQMEYLEKKGFRITTPVGGMDTAFIAEYGAGKPVIGILGEYDALPGLSQQADVTHQEPIPGAAAGHGCGHNLLGTGGVEAVCAIQKLMDDGEVKGTIRYYGCPAEEGGGGKVYMIRDGVFDDLDAAITWHPFSTAGFMNNTLSLVISEFKFKGKTAHAAAAPHMGRSALDAAELMNIGTQFLREHIPVGSQIQYSFLDAGGPKPNVVPDHAAMKYVVRTPNLNLTREIFERVKQIAKGAAMMTGTEVSEPKIIAAYANILQNDVLEGLCKDALEELLPFDFSEEENAYATEFNRVLTGKNKGYFSKSLSNMSGGSTDFSDVSWVVPGVNVVTPTVSENTELHHWGAVAQGKSAGAHRGMHMGAKVMAACAVDLYQNPALIEKARAEWQERLDGSVYASMLPEDARPPQR